MVFVCILLIFESVFRRKKKLLILNNFNIKTEIVLWKKKKETKNYLSEK